MESGGLFACWEGVGVGGPVWFFWGGGAIVLGRIMDVGGGLGPESNK